MRAVLPSIPPVAEATATIGVAGEGSCILALKEREVAEHTP